MKKIVVYLLLVSMMITVFSACNTKKDTTGENTSTTTSAPKSTTSEALPEESKVYIENGLPKDEQVTLKFGFFEGGMGREWFDYAIDTFVEKFPNVKFEVIYSPKIDELIATKIAAGDDDDMFDIFAERVPGGILPLVQNGLIEPQEDLWTRELYDTPGKTLKDVVVDGVYDVLERHDGINYIVPLCGFVGGLFYDKMFFQKYGWNENPRTWQEFLDLNEAIKQEGVTPLVYTGVHAGAYYGFAFGMKPFELAQINGTLDQYMNNYRNYAGPVYMAPEFVENWNRISELGKRGYFAEGLGALNHTQSQMMMIQNKVAMVSTGSWVENEMKEVTPDGFKWGFMGVPYGDSPDDTIWLQTAYYSGDYIWAGKPELNKQWAKEFLIWRWNLDVQEQVAVTGGQLPIRKDFLEDPSRAEKIQSAPRAIFEYMDRNNVRLENGYRNVHLQDPAAQQAGKMFGEAIIPMSLGQMEPEPVLQEAEKLIQEAIANQKKE